MNTLQTDDGLAAAHNHRDAMTCDMGGSRNMVHLLLPCVLLVAVGNSGSPLITRLYFLHGGKRIWFSSWLQSAAFPILLPPLLFSYVRRRTDQGPSAKLLIIERTTLGASTVLGILTSISNYLYAYGVARLPASTSALILPTGLIFTAGFAFLLVKQRFTASSVNAIILLTISEVVLAVRSSGDLPAGESAKAYNLGFIMSVASAVLTGLGQPLLELTFQKAKQRVCTSLLLEIQMVMGLVATACSTVGMWVNHDLKAIPREAREYTLGETKYYVVLVWTAILWQMCSLGAAGMILCTSSLFSAIMQAVFLPVTQVLSVIFFKEKFEPEKGIALTLSLWGFMSYFYGEIKQAQLRRKIEHQQNEPHPNVTISMPPSSLPVA